MENTKYDPTKLFGKNGEGIPWEEATGAENSKRDMEKLKKYFLYSHLLKALAVIFLGLAVISYFGVLPLPNVYWNIGVAILFFILMAGSICIADDIVSPAYSSWDREYLHNDGDGVWGRRDPASEYTNFSVPTIVSVEEYDGGTVMFVNALYRWEGIRMLCPCYIHPDPESLRIPYGSILVSEYIDLGNETLEQEYKNNYDNPTVRLLTAKIVYATQRIEDIENYALDPTNPTWDQTSKPLSLEETRVYLNWYRKYRETNLMELKKFLEQAHTERQALREKLGIPENTKNRWVCKPEEEQGVG
jgi:hypothetical protein